MISPYFFTDRALRVGFIISLSSHSELTFTPVHAKFGIETRYIYKILTEMATFHARLINQYEFKYQTLF